MDHTRFDNLARALVSLTSRRLTLGALLGGALSLRGLANTEAEKHKKDTRGGKGRARGRSQRDRDKNEKNERQDNDRHAESRAVAADAKKKCPPCRKRKKGKCKKRLPDGAACPGGICRSGSCEPTSSGGGDGGSDGGQCDDPSM